MEARRLFQAVAHRQPQAALVRALGEDGLHVRIVKGTQRVKHMLRLRQLVIRRAQPVYDVSGEQRRVLIEADDPRLLRQVRPDPPGAAAGRARHHRHGGAGRVVPVLHARCLGLFAVRQLLPHGLIHRHGAQHGLQLLQRQSAGTQQARRLHRQVDDGALHAHGAVAAVHDAVDLPHHVLHHVAGTGGAGTAGGIAAGRGHRHTRRLYNGAGHRMIRAADAHGVQPAGGAQGHAVPPGQDHGQRPRPEFLRQRVGRLRHIHAAALQPPGVRNVQDQGVVLRATLGLEDAAHRVLVQAVGSQTVHRLRGDPQQAAPPQYGRRLRDGVCIPFRMEYDGFHGNILFPVIFTAPDPRPRG